MTQEAIALRTSGDTYPGISVVQDVNKALATIATDFAGADDPAALAGPFMTWADTGSTPKMLRRRNEANSAWIAEALLFEESAKKGGDATQAFKAAPSTAPEEVAVQSQVFGVGQTRQDLTASRVGDVTYINNTGKPIEVYILLKANGAGGSGNLLRGLSDIVADTGAATGSNFIPLRSLILDEEQYKVTGTTAALIYWEELR